MDKLPLRVIHYSHPHPLRTIGGVQTFAQTLQHIFEHVEYMTPAERDIDRAVRERNPVICENHRVLDWPEGFPVVGFQHGVAAIKFKLAKSIPRWLMARAQKRAGPRPKTLWVANSQWVGQASQRLYGCRVDHVVYYPVDIERFDGRLENEGSRLVLHDGRTRHKGKAQIRQLQAAFPEWQIEALDCPHDQVADRMRKACAFVHLSRYEGNSIVCNEAMAMNLPCMFTRVGLMQDANRPSDVFVVESDDVFGDRSRLVDAFRAFLAELDSRTFNPRQWTLQNATMEVARERWHRAMLAFQSLSGWDLGLSAAA